MGSAPCNENDAADKSRAMPDTEARADLYLFDLDQSPDEVAKIGSVLSDDEHQRAGRFLVADASRHFTVARGTLRRLLGELTSVAPDALTFTYGKHGKPSLATSNEPLYFNLSHSGNIGAIAVSKSLDIGVDVEIRRDVEDGLPERFFSKHEVEALNRVARHARQAAFFRCWTRKEAVIKALGEGFSRPLKSFDVEITDEPDPALIRIDACGDEPTDWRLFSFTPREGAFGAVACRTGGAALKVYRQAIAF